jgi:ubiquinone/menaquinone biosynthesis C-methylase UbiE
VRRKLESEPLTALVRPALLEHRDIKGLSGEDWLGRLLNSVHQPIQDGRLYPGFPDEGTQKAFVGSAYEDALHEGYRFYQYVESHLANRRFKVPAERYLDFGSGWGRISRFFLRDFERGDMASVDVDDGMVSFCQNSAVPGGHFTVGSRSPLPFTDASFRLVTAYSVFTHLPEPLFKHWMLELLRVTAPGGLIAFTIEPERFLEFVETIDPAQPETGWHAALHTNLGSLAARKQELEAKGFTYLPTGGGPYRPPETYGDMVVKPDFIVKSIAGLGDMIAFVDEPQNFWQAVVMVRRHRWTLPFRRAPNA